MEVRLWGTVSVTAGGKHWQPSSPRARHLLACLACQPGEFIPDDAVVDRIWGDDLPEDPRDALYTCAKRLRRAMTANGVDSRSLIRQRGGYRLATAPGSVDICRFRQLIRDARRCDDEPTAAFLYERALRVPSGPPLADVDSPWARRTRHALEQELLSAQLASAAAWLSNGRHEELIPELAQLSVRHPLDETVAALLMQALYRSGRPAETVAIYQRIQAGLSEQLGVVPGPALRTVYQQLLIETTAALPLRAISRP
ncbi:winged helix-turn-helix domain-containing protein [Strepomyces sp. STD 3.1]|nr:winged helix-turn-helix domain-containing protein [Streptomyces sp. STD 3.1]